MNKAIERLLASVGRGAREARSYPVGLHMGTDRMHLVQMRPGASGRPAIRAALAIQYQSSLEETLADRRKLRKLVATAWKQQPFSERHVIAAMPKDYVRITVLSYTAAEGQSDADAIVRELRERIKGSEEDMVVDFMRLRGADARSLHRDAIVAMAQRTEVTRFLDALSEAGLEVDALDIGPSALARAVVWIAPEPGTEHPPNLLLVNFGVGGSFLTVVSGRRLMLDRPIEFSERRLVERLGAAVDMPASLATQLLAVHGFVASPEAPESREITSILKEVLRSEFAALAEEVGKTLVYTASKTRGRRIDKVYLVGAMAHYPGVREMLEETLSMEVKLLDPFSIYEHNLSGDELAQLAPHSAMGIATGLALRNAGESWPTST